MSEFTHTIGTLSANDNESEAVENTFRALQKLSQPVERLAFLMDQIQEASLLAAELGMRPLRWLSRADIQLAADQLNRLIQRQADFEATLASWPNSGGLLASAWRDLAELETLIYGFQLSLEHMQREAWITSHPVPLP